MQLFETEPGRPSRAGQRSTATSSPAPRGGGPKRAPAAARPLAEDPRAARHGVWGPILGKGAAILCGMVALAAIGASSLSRGAGVPLEAATVTRPAGSAAQRGEDHAENHAATRPASVAAAGLMPLGAAPPPELPSGSALDDRSADAGAPSPSGAPTAGVTADGKVILNRADANDLRRLPGVGPKRAEAIVLLRAKLGGRFKRITDLLRVKGIGPKGIKKLEPHVVLDEPKQS